MNHDLKIADYHLKRSEQDLKQAQRDNAKLLLEEQLRIHERHPILIGKTADDLINFAAVNNLPLDTERVRRILCAKAEIMIQHLEDSPSETVFNKKMIVSFCEANNLDYDQERLDRADRAQRRTNKWLDRLDRVRDFVTGAAPQSTSPEARTPFIRPQVDRREVHHHAPAETPHPYAAHRTGSKPISTEPEVNTAKDTERAF